MDKIIQVLLKNEDNIIKNVLSAVRPWMIKQNPELAEDIADEMYHTLYMPLLYLQDELDLAELPRKYLKLLGEIKDGILPENEQEVLKQWVDAYIDPKAK